MWQTRVRGTHTGTTIVYARFRNRQNGEVRCIGERVHNIDTYILYYIE